MKSKKVLSFLAILIISFILFSIDSATNYASANTNQSLSHISFFLTVTKHSQLLFRELLHTHDGILNIQINPTNDSTWTVYGDTEPFLGGWMPDNGDDQFVAGIQYMIQHGIITV